MKIITWNVNGIRAALGKGALDYFKESDADIICIQETKCQVGQAEVDLPGYEQYWNSAEKKGYSGTAIFTKKAPENVNYDIDAEGHDTEGRAITLEFPQFYMITNYTPNAQDGLARIDYRLSWEAANREYLKKLDSVKPLILQPVPGVLVLIVNGGCKAQLEIRQVQHLLIALGDLHQID